MAFPIRNAKCHHKVNFSPRTTETSSSQAAVPMFSRPERPFDGGEEWPPQNLRQAIIEELPPDGAEEPSEGIWEDEGEPVTMTWPFPLIPDLFTAIPPIKDNLSSKTSQAQVKTVHAVLPFLTGTSNDIAAYYNRHGLPHLDRKRHTRFLHKCLRRLPAAYVAADASRPWYFYWVLCALGALGEDVTSYREALISTVRPIQNASGGFGGGHLQMSHLAPTYAIVCALAMVGGQEALDLIDRRAMWKWLAALKQADGGFQMAVGGEEDVRGAYCAAVLISLLNLPIDLPPDSPARSHDTDTLLTNLPEYIASCQGYEGGISCVPRAEAHGAYCYIALACLCVLGDPHVIFPKYLDVPLLVSWLSARQYAPEGGFAGRTNKLVDGCYSHWVGASWSLVNAALNPPRLTKAGGSQKAVNKVEKPFYDREGLIRYILCACQDMSVGGLRDKPSTKSDAYHTLYVLAGLSSAQHSWSYTHSPPLDTHSSTSSSSSSPNFGSAYTWISTPSLVPAQCAPAEQVFDEEDRVEPIHPVFVVPVGVAERVRRYFESLERF